MKKNNILHLFCKNKYVAVLQGLFLLMVAVIPAFSQGINDTVRIKEVVINGYTSRQESHPGRSSIDSIAIIENRNLSLSDLISRYSPVYVKSTGRGLLSTASFRGTDAGHTKVLWNGLEINSPMLGQVDLSQVPVNILDDVNLYYGGSSISETNGALGGIISLENKPGWNRPTGFSISQEIASFGTYQTSGVLHLNLNKLIIGSRAYYLHSNNDFRFLNTGVMPAVSETIKNSDYRRYGILQEAYYRTGVNQLLSFRCWLQHTGRNIPQPMSYEGGTRRELQDDDNLRSVISWKHYGKNGNIEVSSGLSLNRLYYLLSIPDYQFVNYDSRSSENSIFNMFRINRNISEKNSFQLQLIQHYSTVSIKEQIRSEGYQAVRSAISIMTGVYHDFTYRIKSYFLLRETVVDRSIIPLMPSAGISFKMLDKRELYLKSTVARNYNIPTLNELYWIPGGNPDLRPEQGYTADLSADMSFKSAVANFKSEITGYVSWIDDWIIWRPTQYRFWTAENIASVFSRGIEFQFKSMADLNLFRMDISANYNHTLTTNQHAAISADRSRGKQLTYIPKNTFNTHLGLSRKNYFLNYSLSYTGKRYTQSSNEENIFEVVLNPYFINDILIGREFIAQKWKTNLRLGIYNLFNVNYQVVLARPMPGRSFSFIVEFSF